MLDANAIMALSTFGENRPFRRYLAEEYDWILNTVSIYDTLVYYNKDLGNITADKWLRVDRNHAEDDIIFLTIHAGLNLMTTSLFKINISRITNIISQDGSLIFN